MNKDSLILLEESDYINYFVGVNYTLIGNKEIGSFISVFKEIKGSTEVRGTIIRFKFKYNWIIDKERTELFILSLNFRICKVASVSNIFSGVYIFKISITFNVYLTSIQYKDN